MPPQGGRKHPNQEYIRINTENILFICGGAFDGLDKIIEKRKGAQLIGFGSELKKKTYETEKPFADVMSHDIVKYGLIPELVGRIPVIVALDSLDIEALTRIITEPKNSLVRQYKKLFEMDGIDLEFDRSAIEAVAKLAYERRTGARGLRSILESVMMKLMFELPSRDDVESVIVTGEYVRGEKDPVLKLKQTTDGNSDQ